jgi:hypothetical protein
VAKPDDAGLLEADLVGEVLGERVQEAKKDEVKHTEEAAETISVEASELGAAASALTADFPSISRIISSRSRQVLSASEWKQPPNNRKREPIITPGRDSSRLLRGQVILGQLKGYGAAFL